MKKIGVALFFLVVANLATSFAQYGGCDSNSGVNKEFLESKTLYVRTGDDHFDENFLAGMEKYWRVTKYDVIEPEEVSNYVQKDGYSFILRITVEVTENNVTQSYPLLGVVNGARKNMENLSMTSMAAYIVLSHFGDEKKVTDAAWRAQIMPNTLQEYLYNKRDKKVSIVCARVRSTAQTQYNLSNGKIKQRTILIDPNHLTGVSEADIVKAYSGKYKMVNRNRLEEVINENESGYAVFLPVFGRHKYIYLIDTETGEIIYDAYSTYGIKLKKKDFINLAKAAS